MPQNHSPYSLQWIFHLSEYAFLTNPIPRSPYPQRKSFSCAISRIYSLVGSRGFAGMTGNGGMATFPVLRRKLGHHRCKRLPFSPIRREAYVASFVAALRQHSYRLVGSSAAASLSCD